MPSTYLYHSTPCQLCSDDLELVLRRSHHFSAMRPLRSQHGHAFNLQEVLRTVSGYLYGTWEHTVLPQARLWHLTCMLRAFRAERSCFCVLAERPGWILGGHREQTAFELVLSFLVGPDAAGVTMR